MVVTPSAKNHWSDAEEAHGAVVLPGDPTVPTSATAPPPSSSTVAATQGALTASCARMTTRAAGGTVIGTVFGSP